MAPQVLPLDVERSEQSESQRVLKRKPWVLVAREEPRQLQVVQSRDAGAVRQPPGEPGLLPAVQAFQPQA